MTIDEEEGSRDGEVIWKTFQHLFAWLSVLRIGGASPLRRV